MRIAFDVKGTIEGPKKKFVLGLLQYLHGMGHEVIVWSNSYEFAKDAVRDNGLINVKFQSKETVMDLDEESSHMMDLAIDDDRSQTWLASRRFIWVHDLPEATGGIKELAERISAGDWDGIKCQNNDMLERKLKQFNSLTNE